MSKGYLTPTGALISEHDYNFLSDRDQALCQPYEPTLASNTADNGKGEGKKEFVYAIYTGCRFEGGGVHEIYRDKETAIKFGYLLFQEYQEETNRIHQNNPEWAWKEIELIHTHHSNIKLWQNSVDEIRIIEYELK